MILLGQEVGSAYFYYLLKSYEKALIKMVDETEKNKDNYGQSDEWNWESVEEINQ